MTNYTITRAGTYVTTIPANGTVVSRLMEEDIVNMTFTLPIKEAFKIGDTVEVNGNVYVLNQTHKVEKVSTKEFRFTCVFESIKYDLAKTQLLFLDENNEYTISEHSIYATAKDIIQFHILENANRTGQFWELGLIANTETKLLNFSGTNLLMALGMLAEVFDKEFWISGRKINFGKHETLSTLTFRYGQAKGLRSITRERLDETSIYTRLYALGGNTNLPMNYGSTRLKMDVPFLENNSDHFGLIEHSMIFEDIYPQREGSVTGASPELPNLFWDSTIDFDLNEVDADGNSVILLPGTSAKVTFNTGQLAGYTFEVEAYESSGKYFTLKNHEAEEDLPLFSDDFRPKVGDKYVLTDIQMPASYVQTAQNKLKAKAQAELDKGSVEQIKYSLVADPFHFEREDINLHIGMSIRIIDTDLGVDKYLRVIGLTQDLQNKYDVSFELADDSRWNRWFVRDGIAKLEDRFLKLELFDKVDLINKKVMNVPKYVEDIIGTDSLALYIQSSAGDLLMADDLNTTLTPTVERYFKDYTNQVISWQWFRESGTTQEDRDSDELWSLDKQQKDLVLTTDDFTQNVHHHSIRFTCQAIVNNQQIEKSITI